jgi:hypothetical protein
MSTIIEKINKLPNELIDLIKEYLPEKQLVFTDKKHYLKFHHLIKPYIKNYENYIRDMIRRDNDFVFNLIIRENYHRWYKIKQYRYKNMIFKNYLYFTINYCIENESNSCKNVINEFLKEHGLGKNLHKKNIIKYIKWKN